MGSLTPVPESQLSPVKVVVVTGSGRSGTSSVTGTLKRLGLHIPQPEVPTDENNPRGYYEPLWVANFHKDLLEAIPVRTIDARPYAPEIAMASVTPEVTGELRDWLRAELTLGRAQLAIKDTRAYWVYQLWIDLCAELGAELSSLTMLRHPAQVVRSRDTAYLSERPDRFRRQRETTNVAAWVNAALETERVTREHRRAFVPYYDLIGDWRTAMTRAGEQLGITYDTALDAPHPVDDFVTTSLNRSGADWEGLRVSPVLIDLAERTWTAMNSLVAAPHDAAALDDVEALRGEYAALYDLAEGVAFDRTYADVFAVRKDFRKRLAKKQTRIDRLRSRLGED